MIQLFFKKLFCIFLIIRGLKICYDLKINDQSFFYFLKRKKKTKTISKNLKTNKQLIKLFFIDVKKNNNIVSRFKSYRFFDKVTFCNRSFEIICKKTLSKMLGLYFNLNECLSVNHNYKRDVCIFAQEHFCNKIHRYIFLLSYIIFNRQTSAQFVELFKQIVSLYPGKNNKKIGVFEQRFDFSFETIFFCKIQFYTFLTTKNCN